jgi:hypothetical protein
MASAPLKNTSESTETDSTWSSASKLSRKVRELAHGSYHVLKSASEPLAHTETVSSEVLQDLRDLRDQVARLQLKIHARNLGSLIPWVDALRRQVDTRIGHSGKAED